MTTNKKTVSALADLASTFSDRREGDLALLHERAAEIPGLVSAYIASLTTNQRIEGAESDAIRALLGDRVNAYLASVEAYDALAAIRDREATRGVDSVAREAAPKEKTIRVSAPKATAPTSTSPATTSSTNDATTATEDLLGVVDLRTAPASWNHYTALKVAQDAAKRTYTGKKLERTLLAFAGVKSWKGTVEVATKAGLRVLLTEKASS